MVVNKIAKKKNCINRYMSWRVAKWREWNVERIL